MSHLHSLSNDQRSALLTGLGIICRVFWGPDPDQCRDLRQPDYLEPLASLPPPAPEYAGKLSEWINSFPDHRVLSDHLDETYVRLFIADKGGITAPLYQSCYEYDGAPMMGPPAMAMKKRLEASGLAVADQLREPPDHLAVELEYLYFLLEKGWEDGADPALLDEATSFASSVLNAWIPGFHDKLSREPESPFYPLVAALLCALVDTVAGE